MMGCGFIQRAALVEHFADFFHKPLTRQRRPLAVEGVAPQALGQHLNRRIEKKNHAVLTHEGAEYARKIAGSYASEFKQIESYVLINKHSIPKDMVTMSMARYAPSKHI